MRGEVGLHLRPDLERVGLHALDQESEIRCRERGDPVGEVLRREKVSDVDRVEQRLHHTVAEVAEVANVRLECRRH